MTYRWALQPSVVESDFDMFWFIKLHVSIDTTCSLQHSHNNKIIVVQWGTNNILLPDRWRHLGSGGLRVRKSSVVCLHNNAIVARCILDTNIALWDTWAASAPPPITSESAIHPNRDGTIYRATGYFLFLIPCVWLSMELCSQVQRSLVTTLTERFWFIYYILHTHVRHIILYSVRC